MKSGVIFFLTWLVVASATGRAADEPQLFAALGMTKEQKNVPAPSISGVFRELGVGQWEHFGGDRIEWVHTAARAASAPATVYLGCGNGILRSLDSGRTWRLTTGWQVADVISLQIDPAAVQTVYAATGWGVWKSTDGGESWREMDNGRRPDGKYTYALELDRAQPGRVIVGTDYGLDESGSGGSRWRRLSGSPNAPILHLEQSVQDSQMWLIGTLGQGIYLSRDGARTWTRLAPALATAHVYGAALDPTDRRRMAAAGWTEGVWVSADGGKTWTDRTKGLAARQVTAMAFDPRRAGRLWASTFEEGTFYSDDLGATWTLGGLYGASVIELKFLPGVSHDQK